MDTPKVLTQNEAIDVVKNYKKVISHRFEKEPMVILYGSYAKGNARPWSDIDVAVIIPKINDDEWLMQSTKLVHDGHEVNDLIEPILMEQHEDSILYADVMKTGIAV